MKAKIRALYSILSLFFLILSVIEVILFIINPISLSKLIEVIYVIFASVIFIIESGKYNRQKNTLLSLKTVLTSLFGLFISLFLSRILAKILGYSNIFDKNEKIYLTILYFEITIYVLFLIISGLMLVIKEKNTRFKLKSVNKKFKKSKKLKKRLEI